MSGGRGLWLERTCDSRDLAVATRFHSIASTSLESHRDWVRG
jgi:hypothetical protein